MVDGHSLHVRLAGISVGLAVASADGAVDQRACAAEWHALTDVVGHVTLSVRENAGFALRTSNAHDAAARRAVLLYALLNKLPRPCTAIVGVASLGHAQTSHVLA